MTDFVYGVFVAPERDADLTTHDAAEAVARAQELKLFDPETQVKIVVYMDDPAIAG